MRKTDLLACAVDEQRHPGAGTHNPAERPEHPPLDQGSVSQDAGSILASKSTKLSVILFSTDITCTHPGMSDCLGKHRILTTYSSTHQGKPQGQGYTGLFCSSETTLLPP